MKIKLKKIVLKGLKKRVDGVEFVTISESKFLAIFGGIETQHDLLMPLA